MDNLEKLRTLLTGKDMKQAAILAIEVGPEAVPAIIDFFNVDLDGRSKACDLMKIIGSEAQIFIPALIDALNSKNRRAREASVWLLKFIGPEAIIAVPDLIRALKSRDRDLRWGAVSALGGIGPKAKTAVPDLIKALRDRDVHVRRAAAEALGKIGIEAKPALSALAGVLSDQDPRVRENAAIAWRRVGGDKKTLTEMTEKIESEERIWPEIRKLKEKQNTKGLIRLLRNSQDKKLQEQAAIALAEVGDKDTIVPLIIAMYEDEDEYVRQATKGCFKEIIGKLIQADSLGPEVFVKLLSHPNWNVRKEALYSLKTLFTPTWHPSNNSEKILYLLAAEKWEEMMKLGKAAVDSLFVFLNSCGKDTRVLKGVIRILKSIENPRAIRFLRESLSHPDEEVRWLATQSLCDIEDSRTKKLCVKSLEKIALQGTETSLTENLNQYGTEAIKSLVALTDKNNWGAKKVLFRIANRLSQMHWRIFCIIANTLINSEIQDKQVMEVFMLSVASRVSKVYNEAERIGDAYLARIAARKNGSAFIPIEPSMAADEWNALLELEQSLVMLGVRAAEPFTSLLKHDNAMFRLFAAKALGRIGSSMAVKGLISSLTDNDPRCRKAVVEALGKIGDKSSLQPLKHLQIIEKDEDIRISIKDAIWKVEQNE